METLSSSTCLSALRLVRLFFLFAAVTLNLLSIVPFCFSPGYKPKKRKNSRFCLASKRSNPLDCRTRSNSPVKSRSSPIFRMGGGNGAKAAQKRERNAKDAKKEPQSQLKSVSSQFLGFQPFPDRQFYLGVSPTAIWVGWLFACHSWCQVVPCHILHPERLQCTAV